MVTGYTWLVVMAGGCLGAASRYGVGLLTVRLWGTSFPYGTLVVNLVGCFTIGLLFGLADRSRLLTPDMRLFLITGYLGSLTTFSSFTMETVYAGGSAWSSKPWPISCSIIWGAWRSPIWAYA